MNNFFRKKFVVFKQVKFLKFGVFLDFFYSARKTGTIARLSFHYNEYVMNIVPVVDPVVVNVIINFLQNRSHYTSLNGLDSTVFYTSQGVPQGTVLGPPLYNGSAHDIDVSNFPTTLSIYADDNNPLVASCNIADNAREVISSLCHQFDARNLFLNVQKSSKEMRIIFNHSGRFAIHMVEGIEVLDDLKVLGLTIDSKFSFSNHIDKAVEQSNVEFHTFFQSGALVKRLFEGRTCYFVSCFYSLKALLWH